MIHTVYSNSYEVLKAVMMNNIEHLRLVESSVAEEDLFSRAFETVQVVVPSLAVEDDLKRSIAARDGICAGIDCELLGSWMGQFSRDLSNLVGPEVEWMIWQTMMETGPDSLRAQYGRLSHYLDGKDEVAVFRLAQHIAQRFITYASYRFDWILEWVGVHTEMLPRGPEHDREKKALEAHPDFAWQRELWRRLYGSHNWSGTSFIREFPEVLKRFAADGDATAFPKEEWAPAIELPESLHIFTPTVVPPLMLPIIKAFAKPGRHVWLYLLNPTDRYWYDLIPRSLLSWEAADEHAEALHPILADNGRSTRANLDRLWRFTQGPDTAGEDTDDTSLLSEVDAAAFAPELNPAPINRRTARDWEAYAGRHQDLQVDDEVDVQNYFLESGDERLLRRIQDSILDLDPDLKKGDPAASIFNADDDSLLFVRAPTATRELENLVDWLHSQFVKKKDLRPDDVLVVTPDISGLAPLIDKVFGSLSGSRSLPWTIAGARPVDNDPPAMAVTGLLKFLSGRAGLPAFIEWVSLPIVSDRYGFSVSDIALMNDWLVQAGYRFGLSESHLQKIEREEGSAPLPETMHDMSLERALERLTMGFMLPEEETDPWGDTLPVRGKEGGIWIGVGERPRLLASLTELAGKLETHRLAAVDSKTPEAWRNWFADLLADFFPPEYEPVNFSGVRDAVTAFVEETKAAAGGEAPVPMSYALFETAVSGKLKTAVSSATGSNAITFSGMTQMRNIPYRIIAVIGLNADSAFPGTSTREEFDLMAIEPRRGDRDSRIDNRNVFLDLLLQARDNLMISFVTGTGTDADERQPSIVAQELYAWLLDFAGGVPEGEPGFDRRSLGAYLMRKVPLTGYSIDNFCPHLRGWSGTDREMLAALEKAMETGYRAILPPFVSNQGRDWQARDAEVSFDDLMRFWKYPTSQALKQLNIRLPDKAEDRSIDLLPLSNGLAKWLRKRDVWENLEGDPKLSKLIARWKVDPSLGAVGVRDWAGAEDIEVITKIRELFDQTRLAAGVVPMPKESCVWRYSDKLGVRIEFDELYSFPVPAKKKSKAKAGTPAPEVRKTVLLRHLSSEPNGRKAARLFFEYLFYVVTHPDDPVSLGLVFWLKKEKFWLVEGYDAFAAEKMLRALVEAYAATAEHLVQMPETSGPAVNDSYTPDLRADELLLRGRDLEEIWRLRGDLVDVLGKMKAQRNKPDPADVAEDFVRVFRALREATTAAVIKETKND